MNKAFLLLVLSIVALGITVFVLFQSDNDGMLANQSMTSHKKYLDKPVIRDTANVSSAVLQKSAKKTNTQEIKPLLDSESIPELTEADADLNAYDTKSIVNAFLNENYRSEWGVATQEQLESAFSDDKFISDLAEKNMFFNYADCKETICKIAFTYTRNKDSDPVINEAIAMDRNQFLTLKMFSKTKLQNFNSDINFNNGTFEFYLNKPKSQ